MTKKDFNLLVKIIRTNYIREIAEFSFMLRTTFDNFDEDKFVDACYKHFKEDEK